MADRYYFPDCNNGDTCELTGREFHHLVHVMRSVPGDLVAVFDGLGTEADAQIVRLSGSRAELRIVNRRSDPDAAGTEIVLATAIPKSDRFRWLVEKATELGVSRLVPLKTIRSVVHPGELKLEKMRLAVVEACKQSGRNRLMTIDSPQEWGEFIRNATATGPTFVADRSGTPLADIDRPLAGHVNLVIGPEGGLSEAELHQAQEAGAASFRSAREFCESKRRPSHSPPYSY